MSKVSSATTDFIEQKYIPLEPKIKMIIAVVLLLVPVVLFYFFFYEKKSKEITSLNSQKVTLENRLAVMKKKAAKKEKLLQEMEETLALYENTAELLPKEKEIPQLLTDISALGQNAGLDFMAFKPGKEVPKDFYAEIPVSINVTGPYHNLGFFLDQVSKLDRIVSVNNIKMGGPKLEEGEMLLASSCKLMTYMFTNKELTKSPQTQK